MAIHVVQKGDSLWQIARRYDVTVESLMKANGLQSDLLMPGLALYVPTPTLTRKFYQIKPGDTLWNIAQFFQTTVSTIFDANDGLDVDQLEVGRTIDVPTIEKMEMETLGFFVPYSLADFFEKFPTYSQQLTYLAVVSYSLRADGKLVVLLDDRGIAEACRARGVMPLAMVRNVLENGEFRPELVGQMLKSRAAQERFIEQVIAMLDEKRYEGVSIDFEFIPPDARREYVEFLRALKRRLGGRLLHVNVHSKTEESYTNPITGGQDYAGIGDVADIVAVMTMDYGYPGGPPNPVAPIDWMERVIRFAIAHIDRRKLQVGFPLYGYDWDVTTLETTGLSLLAAQNRAIQQRVSIEFEEKTQSPFYEYWQNTTAHAVWFDDIRSFNAKYKLVDFYKLRGVTFWETRLDFPQNWAYIDAHVTVVKK